MDIVSTDTDGIPSHDYDKDGEVGPRIYSMTCLKASLSGLLTSGPKPWIAPPFDTPDMIIHGGFCMSSKESEVLKASRSAEKTHTFRYTCTPANPDMAAGPNINR